jgi:hypothetical protein
MNDADYIEAIARSHDQSEVYHRARGMFEAAQYYQWAADRVRLRQPGLATRGCGGTSLSLLIDEGLIHCSGDMTPEDVHAAANHLVESLAAVAAGSLCATTEPFVEQMRRRQPDGPR